MKVSLNWIKSLLPALDKSPAEIEALLTNTGLEIENYEEVESVKGGLKGLVVGFVQSCEKHPNADKLSLTKVDTGTGELLSIVCGAPNVAAGQKVIVAPVGTLIHPEKGEPFTIQKAKIRGESSEGMLCAEDEIGLGESHAGLLILPDEVPVGKRVSEHFNVSSDVVFEIGLTANRGDAASHLGVARELATVLNLPFSLPAMENAAGGASQNIAIDIQDTEACPRYSGLVLENIQVTDSPKWLKERLQAIGVNSINNVVDITNYVMHELGQPLHAFDYNKIGGEKIVVRRATKDEPFTTLDGNQVRLAGHELMIADAEKPMCIAGVYGGKDSGVSSTTTKIFLESAYFSPDVVRKGAKHHAINTDSSFRFERGTDPEMTIYALNRAAQLLMEYAHATIASAVYDIYPEKLQPFAITLRSEKIQAVTGISIPGQIVEQILGGLGISIVSKDGSSWELLVPRFKGDVTREIDVIEELLRIYGFNNIPLQPQMKMALNFSTRNPLRAAEKKISQVLMGMGFNEIMTNSLSSDKYYEDKEKLVYLSNPLSAEMNVMRGSMLYSALEAIAYNKNRRQGDNRFFEFGKVYRQKEKGFSEQEQLLLVSSGNTTHESWEQKQKPADYHDMKSVAQHITDLFRAESGKTEIGQVDSKTLAEFGIKDPVFYAMIDWTRIASKQKAMVLKPVPQFPVVRRDLSLVLDKAVTFEQVSDVIRQAGSDKIIATNVFDIYEGKPLEAGKKAMSISLDLYDDKKTMSDSDIDPLLDKLMKHFEKNLNAIIRK